MSVTQFGKHVAEHLKELGLCHLLVHAYLIFVIYLLPVETVLMLLIVKETVMFVDYLPQSLEIARWRIGLLVGVNTGT